MWTSLWVEQIWLFNCFHHMEVKVAIWDSPTLLTIGIHVIAWAHSCHVLLPNHLRRLDVFICWFFWDAFAESNIWSSLWLEQIWLSNWLHHMEVKVYSQLEFVSLLEHIAVTYSFLLYVVITALDLPVYNTTIQSWIQKDNAGATTIYVSKQASPH